MTDTLASQTQTQTQRSAVEAIAHFATSLQIAQVPPEVLSTAALHAVDTVGCGLAALALGEGSFIVDGFTAEGSDGPAQAIGIERGLSPVDAALVNGTLFHSLDFDDTHPDSVVHVSAAIVAAAFAAVQGGSGTGKDLLAALVVGNEVSTRLGAAAGGRFHARGFHPTGVCGVFGATAAAARALRLDEPTTENALGVAASMASGLLEFLADGSDTKRLHAGWAAQAGLQAVRLARMGATGPRTALDGRRGLYAAYLHGERVRLDEQLAGFGQTWETMALAYKPYPACHYTHAPVDSLAQVMAEHGLAAEDIAGITAYSDETGVALVLDPPGDKVRPRTAYDAKFSLPFCLAFRAVHGRLDVTSFVPSAINDPAVLALTPLVTYELRQYSPEPDAFGGGVSVRTRDGRTLTHELRYQRGGRENPLADDEVVAKFRTNARLALDAADVGLVEQGLLSLGGDSDLGFLRSLGRAVPART